MTCAGTEKRRECAIPSLGKVGVGVKSGVQAALQPAARINPSLPLCSFPTAPVGRELKSLPDTYGDNSTKGGAGLRGL
jgi:hypothetical protein